MNKRRYFKPILFAISIIALSGLVSYAQPTSAPSPFMTQGELSDFITAASQRIELLRDPQAVTVALICLEAEPSTANLLGTPFANEVETAMLNSIRTDLSAGVWADLHCVAGESVVVAACMQRAARYKEISIPLLWKLSQSADAGADKTSSDRLARHAYTVLKRVCRASNDKTFLIARLRKLGLDELAGECGRITTQYQVQYPSSRP